MGRASLKGWNQTVSSVGAKRVVDEQESRGASESLTALLEEENLLNFLPKPQTLEGRDRACFNCFTRACRLVRLTAQLAELRRTIVENFLKKSTEEIREESETTSADGEALLSKLLDCKKCDKKFRSLKGYNKHMKRHLENTKESSCIECRREFSTPRQYARHQFSVHHVLTQIACATCNRNFQSEKSLAKHNMEVHSQNAPCDICDKVFFTAANLVMHKKSVHSHNTDKKVLFCEFCPGSFSNGDQLKQHQKRHFGSQYQCNLCSKTFRWDSSLNSHMQAAHNNSSPGFQCNDCGRSFKDKNNYKKHTFTHSTSKPYACTMCRKGFIRKDLLKKHEISCAILMTEQNPPGKPQIRTYVNSKVTVDA